MEFGLCPIQAENEERTLLGFHSISILINTTGACHKTAHSG